MMRKRAALAVLAGAVSVVATLVVLVPAAAPAQPAAGSTTAQPPRTADGRPDLQGVWSFSNYTPLERPLEFAGKESLTAEEAAAFREARTSSFEQNKAVELAYDIGTWFDQGQMGSRTSLIVDPPDGRLPPMTSGGEQRAAARAERRRRFAEAEAAGEYIATGPEDVGLWSRCIVAGNAGPPIKSGPYNNAVQIFQTPDVVALLHEQIHNVRMITLGGRPQAPLRQWTGQSRGRWEGDTLIVETANLYGAAAASFAVGAAEDVRLTERFARIDDETLLVRIHGGRSHDLDSAVDCAVCDDEGGGDLRVRVPRGEPRHVRHPECRAIRGERGRTRRPAMTARQMGLRRDDQNRNWYIILREGRKGHHA